MSVSVIDEALGFLEEHISDKDVTLEQYQYMLGRSVTDSSTLAGVLGAVLLIGSTRDSEFNDLPIVKKALLVLERHSKFIDSPLEGCPKKFQRDEAECDTTTNRREP